MLQFIFLQAATAAEGAPQQSSWSFWLMMILIFVVTVPVSVLFTRYRSKKVRPLFSARSRKYGELNGYAEEMLTGSRSISAYGREDVISSRFNKHNDEAMDAFYKAEYHGAMLFPTINFINKFAENVINSVYFPVPKSMPQNMKDELDKYLGNKK